MLSVDSATKISFFLKLYLLRPSTTNFFKLKHSHRVLMMSDSEDSQSPGDLKTEAENASTVQVILEETSDEKETSSDEEVTPVDANGRPIRKRRLVRQIVDSDEDEPTQVKRKKVSIRRNNESSEEESDNSSSQQSSIYVS